MEIFPSDNIAVLHQQVLNRLYTKLYNFFIVFGCEKKCFAGIVVAVTTFYIVVCLFFPDNFCCFLIGLRCKQNVFGMFPYVLCISYVFSCNLMDNGQSEIQTLFRSRQKN